jgi:hypothetical protein
MLTYLKYGKGFKVFRWMARKLFVSDEERSSFFSSLCQYELNRHPYLFDFIMFQVFETSPRILFDKFYKENVDVRGLHINNILRFVELGWYHNSYEKVLHHQANAVFNCAEIKEVGRLLISRISLLDIFQKVFNLYPEGVTLHVYEYLEFWDIGSVHLLKTFYQFLRLKVSVEARFRRIFFMFDEVNKLCISNINRVDRRKSPSSLKRLRVSEDE